MNLAHAFERSTNLNRALYDDHQQQLLDELGQDLAEALARIEELRLEELLGYEK